MQCITFTFPNTGGDYVHHLKENSTFALAYRRKTWLILTSDRLQNSIFVLSTQNNVTILKRDAVEKVLIDRYEENKDEDRKKALLLWEICMKDASEKVQQARTNTYILLVS